MSDRVSFQEIPQGVVPVFHQCVIRVPDRDALCDFFKERGVGHAVYYPHPLHLQECYADLGHSRGDFPHSEQAASEVMALPIYPELSLEQQNEVVETLQSGLGA